MNPEDDMNSNPFYPRVETYDGQNGARVSPSADQCLTVRTEGQAVRFAASASRETSAGLDGVMYLDLKTAREFLNRALESLPTPKIKTRRFTDESGDTWFETESGGWIGRRHLLPGEYYGCNGAEFEEVAQNFGVWSGSLTQVEVEDV